MEKLMEEIDELIKRIEDNKQSISSIVKEVRDYGKELSKQQRPILRDNNIKG